MRRSYFSVGVVAMMAVVAPSLNQELSFGFTRRSIAAAPREVEIVGLDYAFRVPSNIPAGRTTFHFVNKGKVGHEFNIVLLKQSATIEQYMAAWNADQSVEPLIDATIGVLFAAPGKEAPSALSTELLAGRTYALICIFKDNRDAPRHLAMGMFSAIRVVAAQGAPTPPPRVDTIVGMDYAFRAPTVLAPGRHYLTFVNQGAPSHFRLGMFGSIRVSEAAPKPQ